ncbi:LLM class F420-dependent oxidoreductase [Amycolatopsis benzoatilytica]|uniref:LLM class F420-dependent oxidoreductase n=1 Tax=Amycolatopsis benzoatilytica TaxID=346045 RepID=UPI000488E0A2|nr:LLM class F420-dependent oxidoreductase [Amycolatopsis benzoatilytica]
MRYGIVLFTSDRGICPAAAAQAAEEAGFATFYVPEHTHIPVRRTAPHPRTGDASLPDDRYLRTLDPWVALASAVPVTSTIRLATAVALPVESDPITLAKTIATLDHLSGGRVTLGVGFGWNTDELADHGVPGNRRRTALREYLEAMRALWTEDEASYAGEFVEFGPSWAWPKPVQEKVPVLVGAGGTERTFRWIARNGDGWMTTPGEGSVEEIAGKVGRLRELWAEEGRRGQPEVVALGPRPDPEGLARLAEAGVTEVVFGLPDRDAAGVEAWLDRLAGKLGQVAST